MLRLIIGLAALDAIVILTVAMLVAFGGQETRDLLKEWQSGIGITVGAVGLGLAALINAHLARRRDTRLKRLEARELASALIGELRALKRILLSQRGMAQALLANPSLLSEDIISGRNVSPEFASLPATESLTGVTLKLGLIGEVLASDIKYFYLSLASEQQAYKTIHQKDGLTYAVKFISQRRGAHAHMINLIVQRLEDHLAGKPIPPHPRMWDFEEIKSQLKVDAEIGSSHQIPIVPPSSLRSNSE